jgi:ubiquinol-cytochrome c reductase iron-sulfur subunit
VSDESAKAPSVTPVKLSEPHLQPLAKHPERVQALAALSMVVGFLGFIGFGIAYWVGNNTQWQAATFGVGLLGLGAGVIAWGKYLMAQGPFVEDRHDHHSSDEERKAMASAIVERGGMEVKRRKVLGGLFALGSAVMGLVLLFPLIRSLGPKPGRVLFETNWTKGARLVTVDGRQVTVDDLVTGGVLTVFPQGFAGESPDQTILIRLNEQGPDDPPYVLAPPGKTSWGVQGYVAYSKMCTHLGCPVGLYQEQTQQLVCPCHQSIFNVRAGAVPEFGPAPRPLPQLPLAVDAAGYLVANGGFDQAVGPGFWERP